MVGAVLLMSGGPPLLLRDGGAGNVHTGMAELLSLLLRMMFWAFSAGAGQQRKSRMALATCFLSPLTEMPRRMQISLRRRLEKDLPSNFLM